MVFQIQSVYRWQWFFMVACCGFKCTDLWKEFNLVGKLLKDLLVSSVYEFTLFKNDIINDSIKQSSTASAKYYLICLSDLDHEKFLIKIIISFPKTQISDPLY